MSKKIPMSGIEGGPLLRSEAAREATVRKMVERDEWLEINSAELAKVDEVRNKLQDMKAMREALETMQGSTEAIQTLDIAMQKIDELVSSQQYTDLLARRRELLQKQVGAETDLGQSR